MKDVTFQNEFRFRTGSAETRVFPAGWKGAVDDAVAAAARKAGALASRQRKKAAPQAASAQGGEPDSDKDGADEAR